MVGLNHFQVEHWYLSFKAFAANSGILYWLWNDECVLHPVDHIAKYDWKRQMWIRHCYSKLCCIFYIAVSHTPLANFMILNEIGQFMSRLKYLIESARFHRTWASNACNFTLFCTRSIHHPHYKRSDSWIRNDGGFGLYLGTEMAMSNTRRWVGSRYQSCRDVDDRRYLCGWSLGTRHLLRAREDCRRSTVSLRFGTGCPVLVIHRDGISMLAIFPQRKQPCKESKPTA